MVHRLVCEYPHIHAHAVLRGVMIDQLIGSRSLAAPQHSTAQHSAAPFQTVSWQPAFPPRLTSMPARTHARCRYVFLQLAEALTSVATLKRRVELSTATAAAIDEERRAEAELRRQEHEQQQQTARAHHQQTDELLLQQAERHRRLLQVCTPRVKTKRIVHLLPNGEQQATLRARSLFGP